MQFRNAGLDELDTVLALYKSVLGERFCVWNEYYPGMEELRHDFETGNLYVLNDGGELIGALSVVPENELDGLSLWRSENREAREIARIVIDKKRRGAGLAAVMVNRTATLLSERGYRAIRLSAAKINLPALKTYQKLGFETVGEAELYGGGYYLLEKLI